MIEPKYYRIDDLATTKGTKAYTYTDKKGRTLHFKAKPAKIGILPFSKSTIWVKVKAGKFPKPVKLSSNITAWRKSDIDEWLNGVNANEQSI